MLRFEVSENGGTALPAIDTADSLVVIGSGPTARVRLPAEAARDAHVRIDGMSWTLLAESKVGGMLRAAGDSGSVGRGLIIELGNYRVHVSPAPAGVPATPQQRTESLARELVRSLLGDGAAPSFEIERGPHRGARRALAPPESTLVIGRGDEAGWIILDDDLSRTHAEIHRGWDGVTVVDLDSKNGTRLDGQQIGTQPVALRDGALLALGKLAMRFHDPAERHLRGEPPAPPPRRDSVLGKSAAARATSGWPFVAFTAITVLAVAALVWILAT